MKAYISSTYLDLELFRRAAYDALRKLRVDTIAMEDYVATDDRPLAKCIADVKCVDVYIGIFAWRYGCVPSGQAASITELEYGAAREAHIPTLIFLLRPDAPWPEANKDPDLSNIRRLRADLEQNHVLSYFDNPDNLATLVITAIAKQFRGGSLETIALSPTLADKIYNGAPGDWPSIVDAAKHEVGRDWLSRSERLALVVSYDIARIRRVADNPNPLVFVDSSWLSHDYSFWQTSPDMVRWLRQLGEVAMHRARHGWPTCRAFYWAPDQVKSHETILHASETILQHLKFGMTVFLIEPNTWSALLDFQLFTESDGLSSSNFGDIQITQHQGHSQTQDLAMRARDLDDLRRSGNILVFDSDCKPDEVMRRLVTLCPQLSSAS